MKKILIITAGVLILFIGGSWMSSRLSGADTTVITRKGFHWHPSITIYVDDKQVSIPVNMGITGNSMSSIHTHSDVPKVHVEFSGKVIKDQIMLKQFFKGWHKHTDIYSFGKDVKMTVNGIANTQMGEYVMQDGDNIVLRYTTNKK